MNLVFLSKLFIIADRKISYVITDGLKKNNDSLISSIKRIKKSGKSSINCNKIK